MQCASKMCFVISLEQMKDKILTSLVSLICDKRGLGSGFVQSMLTVLSTLYLNVVRGKFHSLVILSTSKPSYTAFNALISVGGKLEHIFKSNS